MTEIGIFTRIWRFFFGSLPERLQILKAGKAMRVIFFYPGEEGTYIDNAEVILFENGIVHIQARNERTTTHLQNCEIIWRFDLSAEDNDGKVVRLHKQGRGDPRPEPPQTPPPT